MGYKYNSKVSLAAGGVRASKSVAWHASLPRCSAVVKKTLGAAAWNLQLRFFVDSLTALLDIDTQTN